MFIHTEFMFSETPFYVLGNSFVTFYFFTEDVKRSLKLPVHSSSFGQSILQTQLNIVKL